LTGTKIERASKAFEAVPSSEPQPEEKPQRTPKKSSTRPSHKSEARTASSSSEPKKVDADPSRGREEVAGSARVPPPQPRGEPEVAGEVGWNGPLPSFLSIGLGS
jgi:hypothetical protein